MVTAICEEVVLSLSATATVAVVGSDHRRTCAVGDSGFLLRPAHLHSGGYRGF